MEWVVGGLLLAVLCWPKGKNGLLERAAQGVGAVEDKVAAAYWSLYGRTHRPKSRWIMMSKEQKSNIYRERERLRGLYECFPTYLQQKVMQDRSRYYRD